MKNIQRKNRTLIRIDRSLTPILVPAVLMIVLQVIIYSAFSCGPRPDDGPQSVSVIELDSGWRFRESCEGKWTPATVPGCIHTDLVSAGLIPDLLFGDNEEAFQWIGEKVWLYKCEFSASDHLLRHSSINLELDGLDTYAKVELNDSLVLDSDNMFRQWKADIKPYLKEGKNVLEVKFFPPGKKEERKREYPSRTN